MNPRLPKYLWLYQQLKEELKNKIDWDFLGTQEEIKKRYKVGRGTVILALRKLSEEGLIRSIKKKGTFVKKSQVPDKVLIASHPLELHFTVPAKRGSLLFSIDDYIPEHIRAWEEVIKAFEKEHHNIKIQLRVTETTVQSEEDFFEYIEEIKPDVFQVLDWRFQYLIEKEAFVDLTPLIENGLLKINDFFPSLLPKTRYDKGFFGLPSTLNIPVLFINKSLWDKVYTQPPPLEWDWEEYFACVEKISNRLAEFSTEGIIPVATSIIDPVIYFFLIGIKIQKEEEFQIDSWRIKKFLEEFWKDKNYRPLSENRKLFDEGKIAIFWESYIGSYNLKRKDFYLTLPPYVKGEEFPICMEIIGINRNTPHLGEAARFISFLGSREAWQILTRNRFLPPMQGLPIRRGRSPNRVIFQVLPKIYQKPIIYAFHAKNYPHSLRKIMRREFESFLEGHLSLDGLLKDVKIFGKMAIEREKRAIKAATLT